VLFRTDFEFKLDSLETPTFRQFAGGLSQPTHLSLFQGRALARRRRAGNLTGAGLCFLDRLMGGPGDANPPARELTEIEIALLGQVSQLLTEAWCAHWAGLEGTEAARIGHESDPHYLQTSAPESTQLVATFTAQIGECTGQIRLALPFPTLEPLLQKIRAEVKPPVETPAPTAAPAKPASWNPALDHVNIPIQAELPGPQITARLLQSLQVGDVLSLPAEAANQVQLRLGGVPVHRRLGTRDDHWAVEVLNALKS
jgi:flagellar motor switch protein FliM